MPLNDAVPSSARDVATRNMQDLDKFVNGEQFTNNNRLGAAIRSIAGIQNEANQAFGNIGYVPVSGSFESGGTVTARNEVLLYEADGYYYKWAGTLPKVVAPASTPATAGGVGAGFWSAVGGISTGFFAVLTGTLTAAQTTIATDKEGGDPGGAVLDDSLKVFLRQNAKWTISGGLDAYVSDDYVLTIIGTPVGGETFTVEQNADDLETYNQGYVILEKFKHLVVSNDWSPAIIAAIDHAVLTGVNDVRGFGSYTLGSQVDLSTSNGADLPRQFKLYFGEISPLATFPDNTDMFSIAKTSSSEIRDLRIFVGTIDGDSKRVGFINNAGGTRCRIEFINASNLWSVYNCDNNVYASASTKVVGQLITNCRRGIYAEGDSGKIAEGTLIDIQFLANCDKAGIFLGKTARYADIKGQSDFCGKHFISLTMSGITSYSVGDTLTQGANNGTIVAIFETAENISEIILDENSATALFTTGSVTDGVTPETVNAVHKSGSGDKYYDIIDNSWDASNRFSRHSVFMSYCGGFFSDYIAKASCFIQTPNVYSQIFNDVGPYSHYVDVASKLAIVRNNLTDATLLRTSSINNTTRVNYDLRGDWQFNGNVTTYDDIAAEGGGWDEPHFVIGPAAFGYHIWRDSQANMRWKGGPPASDLDGFKVGPIRKIASQVIGTTQTGVAHGLGYAPTHVMITLKSNGIVWESAAADAGQVYLTASVSTTVDVYVM